LAGLGCGRSLEESNLDVFTSIACIFTSFRISPPALRGGVVGRVLVLGGLGKHSEQEEHIALNVLDLKTQRWFKPAPVALKVAAALDPEARFSLHGPSPRAGFASCKVRQTLNPKPYN
jgi:hypothetical protein